MEQPKRLIANGSPVEFRPGESVLTAMLRAGQHPTGGGCLCLGGDCPHCLATVDGVSYVRTCQTAARPGLVVTNHPIDHAPELPEGDYEIHRQPTQATHTHCDVVVILFGSDPEGEAEIAKAEAAGKQVVVLNTDRGEEPTGIYPGPKVVARTDSGMVMLYPKEEIIVATGAAEIQPVAPGNLKAGLVTSKAAPQLAAAGIDLGKVVAIGTPPEGIEYTAAPGLPVRFEGNGHVEAVVVMDGNGDEQRYECDTVSIGLGIHPRNALALMGNGITGVSIRTVGDAALEADVPACPAAGVVCACSMVTVDELDHVYTNGFQEMELLKRSTLAGTGPCQGRMCLPHMRSFLQDRGGELQPRFTARPVNRQLTLGEIAAGAYLHAEARTALHEEHLRHGAYMQLSGHWLRPWNYGNTEAEYWAVREAVSIMDVSTLGKFIVSGPDALPFLERIYPTHVSTIKTGRSRYVLTLNERGYVMDDGLVAKESDTRYALTFTSGGSSVSEMWMRDWANGWGFDVRILNQTYTLGAINVTGPYATELLERAGLDKPLKFMRFRDVDIAGVACRIFRLSFTGEASYELHHPAEDSVKLWQALMRLGQDLGIRPHGLEALLMLRLEKGHIVVNQDTDLDSTPKKIHHDWMVKMEKPFFLGKPALDRIDQIELEKMLVGFEMGPGEAAPIEGATIRYTDNGEYAGFITSAADSPSLGKPVMLGWLYYKDGVLPDEVTIEGRKAVRSELPFYDAEGARAKA